MTPPKRLHCTNRACRHFALNIELHQFPSTFPPSRAFKLSLDVPNLPGAFCHCCNAKNQKIRQRKEEARAKQTITEGGSDRGRCLQPFPLTHLPSRDAKADVLHCCDAFVREVVDLGEVLELHHVEISFARLHPAPLSLHIPILHGRRGQKGGFAMHSVKQEPGGGQRGTASSTSQRLDLSYLPGHAYNTQSFYSLLVFAPPSVLFLPVFPSSFSLNILEQVLPCGQLLMQVTGMFSVLSVCTQGRGEGESQTEEAVSGMTALTNSLSIHPPNPKARAAVPASTKYQGTL